MKSFFLGVSLIFLSACFSGAQNKTLVPLLGSKQLVESSEFCKKYKCKAMPREYTEGTEGYVLELSGDETWQKIMSYPNSKGKMQPNLWSKYRSLMYTDVDRETGQLKWIEFQLRVKSGGRQEIYSSESAMLADAIYYIVGKRLALSKNQNELFAPDVNDCFLFSRAFPEENISRLTRVMMKSEITLQDDKKKVKYHIICDSDSTPILRMFIL